jgi:hypothetical protein
MIGNSLKKSSIKILALLALIIIPAGCGSNDSSFIPIRNASSAYPVRASQNGRYLIDQNNAPFLIVGDSAQALIANLTMAQAALYFSNRQNGGFNSVWINLLCATHTGGRDNAATYDGIQPFNVPGDLSTPNESYFARADAMIRLAAQYDLLVFLDPAETIDWLNILRTNGTQKARDYGRYLGARYQSFDNIVWFNGNDFQDYQNRENATVVQAVALGIQDADNRHSHTVLLNFDTSGSLDDETWRPIIQLNASYTYFSTYAQVLKDYNRVNPLPTFLAEGFYELERDGTDPKNLRKQQYWAILSGAAGYIFGNRFTWQFISGWPNNLNTTGVQQVGIFESLFVSLEWQKLIPDQNHAVVTSGLGSFASSGGLTGNNYLTAAAAPDGTLAVAYIPSRRTISVDLSRFSAPINANWFDPTNGNYTLISSSMQNSGIANLTPPVTNGAGADDWALVLETK